MFLGTSIFSVLAIPSNIIAFYIKYKQKKDVLFWICFSLDIFFALIFIVAGFYGKGWEFVLFCFIVAISYFIFVESLIDFYCSKKLNMLSVAIWIIPTMILLIAFSYPTLFNAGFKYFLQSTSYIC